MPLYKLISSVEKLVLVEFLGVVSVLSSDTLSVFLRTWLINSCSVFVKGIVAASLPAPPPYMALPPLPFVGSSYPAASKLTSRERDQPPWICIAVTNKEHFSVNLFSAAHFWMHTVTVRTSGIRVHLNRSSFCVALSCNELQKSSQDSAINIIHVLEDGESRGLRWTVALHILDLPDVTVSRWGQQFVVFTSLRGVMLRKIQILNSTTVRP